MPDKNLLFIAFLLLTGFFSANAAIRYVKPTSTGTGDGLSWANASGNLQATIDACVAGDEVWVAAGTYKPTLDAFGNASPTDPREKTFYFKDGIKFYGGFIGFESSILQRVRYTYPTILSGDIDNNNTLDNGNAYHVVIASAAVSGGIGVTIDGFDVTGGLANGTLNITVNGNQLTRNGGGGIYVTQGINTISNNKVYGNSCNLFGGGMYFNAGTTTASGNWVYNNTATAVNGVGGGMRCFNGTFTIDNNFIYNNTAGGVGGGLVANPLTTVATVLNNVIYGNTSGTYGGGLFSSGGTVYIYHNTVYNNTAATYGGGICVNNNTSVLVNNILWGNKLGSSTTVPGADYGYNLVPPSGGSYQLESNGLQLTGNGAYTAASKNDFQSVGGNYFNTDPQFVNSAAPLGADGLPRTADDGLSLACNSTFLDLSPLSRSNVDILGSNRPSFYSLGAYELAGKAAFDLPGASQTLSLAQSGTTIYAACGGTLIATVTSSGTNPVGGSVTAKVWVSSNPTPQYVKRHYEVTPTTDAATATGKITLYFTNQEFKDFNAGSPALLLPDNDDPGTITARKANLKIEKRGGTGNTNGDLNSYTGTIETVDPADEDIFWNASNNRWEVSFNVSGFSGFFVKTQAQVLPVEFGTISGTIRNGILYVNFSTLKETNNDHFIIEGSADGVNFKELGQIMSKNGNSDTQQDYEFSMNLSSASFAGLMALGLLAFVSFNKGRKRLAILAIAGLLLSALSCKKVNDINPDEQSLYIRIAQVDQDGGKSYSKVVKVVVKK